ncbi:hypothetical protein KORDIASMS9_03494 [Kordia sp. SMS9]|uniref:DinB family protein n=1 Tax=Kordia sp. SMS9 TaxID=2282170 RepID=UPI000E0CF366|nr:DinB family protein [Kordia sp. SMS9]AXG71237.1 hypothetical protein KORDIASMS9_03494 [Kordia sp. SMS9]
MKKRSYNIILALFLILSVNCSVNAQSTIEVPKGYTTQIGNMVSMLEDLKTRVTSSVKNLSQEETDFLLDKDANRVGAMILHLAATEKYYQVYTFEGRAFNKEEEEAWMTALGLGEKAREKYVGKPIDYYLKIWDEVRKETLTKLKEKDDTWFKSLGAEDVMSNQYAWYHVMEHQANHMGQIRLVIKRIPKK